MNYALLIRLVCNCNWYCEHRILAQIPTQAIKAEIKVSKSLATDYKQNKRIII